jgi:hypothetical protein
VPEDVELNVHQIAYICGGPAQVALAAVVGLHEDGHIAIARARRRVTVLHRDQSDPVRAAVVESIPETGRTLGFVLAEVPESDAVADVERTLRDRGLLQGSGLSALWSSRVRAARKLRQRLMAEPPADAADPRRVAVLGAAAIGDPAIRRIFQTPDPDLTVPSARPRDTRSSDDGYNAPDRGREYGGGSAPGW